jgi:hypothetical protein
MFRSLLYDHPQGSSFVLSAFTTFRMLSWSFAEANDEASSRKMERTESLYLIQVNLISSVVKKNIRYLD